MSKKKQSNIEEKTVYKDEEEVAHRASLIPAVENDDTEEIEDSEGEDE